MTTMQPRHLDTNLDSGDQDPAFEPLTAEQAEAWRTGQPKVSPWRLLMWQIVALASVGACVLFWLGEPLAWSFLYGGVAVVLPSGLMILGLHGRLMRRLSVHPAGSLIGFALLEVVKLLLSVLLMAAAPQVIGHLSWLALLAGVWLRSRCIGWCS